MPSVELMGLEGKATLFRKTGVNKGGEEQYGEPEAIEFCRLDYDATESKQANGKTISLDGTLRTNLQLAIGDMIWDGELDDWVGTGNDEPMLYVKTDISVKDVKQRNVSYAYGVGFSKNG
jgi:hypothetical protein